MLAVQKPMNRPGWWKGKFTLLQMPATELGVEDGGQLPEGRFSLHTALPPPATATSGARAFIDRSEGGRLHAETIQSSLTIIFKLIISGLTSVILIILDTVNLQF